MTTKYANATKRRVALRETAHRYLTEIDTLSRNRLPSDTAEKLNGMYVVLQAMAAGQRTTPSSLRLNEWCDRVLDEARRKDNTAHPERSPAMLHLTFTVVAGTLVLMLGLNNNLLFPLALLAWLGYVYCVIPGKVFRYIRSDRLPIEGSMKKPMNSLGKTALALALVAGATILGMTVGIGGVIFALVVGIALVLRAKLKHVSPQPLPDTRREEVNPATGAPMMPGGLLDSRANPWGMRNRD